ncbi:MAG: hypothetical protein U0271_12290 [Polyangiaceae bacterium]
MLPANLNVVFVKPGWFMVDVAMTVVLDRDRVLHSGSFLGGIDRVLEVELGPHTLETILDLGAFSRRRSYSFTLEAPTDYRSQRPTYRAVLRYSRFWGNFTRGLAVERIDG